MGIQTKSGQVKGADMKTTLMALGLVIAVCCFAQTSEVTKYDPRMAVEKAVVTNGVKWIDGRYLPIEGRMFDDVDAYYDRLPSGVTTNVNGGVRGMKHHSAGLQFRFKTDSRKLVFKWIPWSAGLAMDHMPATGVSGIDVYRRDADGTWKYVKTGRIHDGVKGGELSLAWRPGDDCLVNLPLYNGVKSFTLGIDEKASVSAPTPRANGVVKPVVFYGTSITHGGCASRPGLAFVNVVGRKLDVPVVNLGFSGSGKMELEMSEHLARIDASCYVLDCLWNMDDRLVKERYEPFIRNLRAKRPDVPIVMAEQCDVYCQSPSGKDTFMRGLYDALVAEGWKNLVYLPKDKMYVGDNEGTVDGCHPNDWGMMSMADAFGAAVRQALKLPASVDEIRPGETTTAWNAGGIDVRVGVRDGHCAEIRAVRAFGERIAVGPQPLFTAIVEDVKTGRRTELASSDAWAVVAVATNGAEVAWSFTAPAKNAAWTNLAVTVRARPGADGAGLDWSFVGATGSDDFAFCEATVGALEFLSTGAAMRALYPGCMGHVVTNPCTDKATFRGNYSSMHCVMPWEAVWDERRGTGFYVGAHDPKGGAKTVALTGSSARSAVRLALTHRLAWDGAHPGAASEMSGTIHWRPFTGDWYEAALVYRDFVREHAVWYPKMGPEGRVSTPLWFKKLGYVVRTYGWADTAVADVKTCQDYLGVPVMAHWYHWHQIPFDNDYPHYFPTKPGFEDGVKRIQAMGAYAVPYTNGHIWDMHDRGAEDWQFSSVGAKGACMKRDGTFYTERYRSVETNGERVVFAPMCPASQVWHDKVGENCDKVVNGAGLNGYYMDQVGAFATIDCRNPAHGHPFGGGSWWQEGYRRLLADARARCGGKDVLFATEGNGEHTFDQVDALVCWNVEGGVDTVPAFEVCYSGAVTIYCRSYVGAKGNGWRQMRMKFANVVADGHLMGWMPAAYCREPKLNAYLRTCVRFRHHNAGWFYKGEMRRPPKLLDAVPEWDEAWDIFGRQRPTRMPIVQTAARTLLDYDYAPDGRRLWQTGRVRKAVVYFTNFSDVETATTRVAIDWADLGVDPRQATFVKVDAEGRRTPFSCDELSAPLTFAPGVCFGVEICPLAQSK